jgi:predicted PurR-regulated permease PerM
VTEERAGRAPVPPESARAFRTILLALVIASAWIVWPYLPWLVLAGWSAALAMPLVDRLAPRRGGRRVAAAAVTSLIVVLVAVPTVLVGLSLWRDADQLLQEVRATGTGRRAIELLVADREAGGRRGGGDVRSLVPRPEDAVRWMRRGGPEAWSMASDAVAAAAKIALGIVIYLAGTYVGLVQGRRAFAWLLTHVPLARRDARRLAAAYVETGRGLLVGIGLTGLIQGVIAGLAYVAIGMDRALVLGFLTFLASFVPTVGTGLVWLPVVLGLWLTGRPAEALAMLAWNALVVSTIDNVLRPVLSRFGRMDMHVLVLLVAMVGGLVVLGPWGVVMGPLVVRLTIEAIRIASPSVPSAPPVTPPEPSP